jgi:hypothetical protein
MRERLKNIRSFKPGFVGGLRRRKAPPARVAPRPPRMFAIDPGRTA